MKRMEWVFEYTARTLALAAQDKSKHHAERKDWWLHQKELVMDEVKESGIEVSESLAVNYSNTTMKMAPQVMVRNDLQTKLTECHGKIIEHSNKEKEYDGWYQALYANLQSRFVLHQDDWLYFFGK